MKIKPILVIWFGWLPNSIKMKMIPPAIKMCDISGFFWVDDIKLYQRGGKLIWNEKKMSA